MSDVHVRSQSDWENLRDDVVEVCFEQADKYLKAQLDVSLAADRRALASARMFLGLATAVAAALVAYISSSLVVDIQLVLAAVVFFLMLLGSASVAFWSGRPVKFFFQGNWPSAVYDQTAKSGADIKRFECCHYDRYIRHNHAMIEANGKLLNWSIAIGVSAPLVAGVVYFLALWVVSLISCSST